MQALAHAIGGFATAAGVGFHCNVSSAGKPYPAPRPGPRLRRGRFKARAPVARKQCLVAPGEMGVAAVCLVPLAGRVSGFCRWQNLNRYYFSLAPFSASRCRRICASTAAIAVMFITLREVALVVRICTGLEIPMRIGPIATPSVNTRTRL